MLFAKIGWNWPSGSGEKDFFFSWMYFRYFSIISTWKRAWPFLRIILNTFPQGCFVPSLVEIDSVVLEKKIFLISSMFFGYFVIIPLGKGHFPSFEGNWIPFTQGCFEPSSVEIGSGEKVFFLFRKCVFAISYLSHFGKGQGPSFEQTWIPSPKDALCKVWLKLAQ